METNQTTRSGAAYVASIAAASLLLLSGLALLVYFLTASDGIYAMSVWQFSLYALLPLVPVIAGGMWLNVMYRRGKGRRYQWVGGGLAFGLLLILFGLFMLGFATDAINIRWRPVFISWQMLVIVLGVTELCKRNVWGLILLIVGHFFLIPRVDRIFPDLISLPDNFTSVYWPALLIAGGVAIVLGMIVRPKCRKSYDYRKYFNDELENEFKNVENEFKNADSDFRNAESYYAKRNRSGKVEYNFVFAGSEQVFLEPEFNGGEINVVFGGMSLDLRNTHLPADKTVYLEVNAVFGGVNIFVPATWEIELRGSSVLGNFSDKRRRIANNEEKTGHLIITADCVCGGGEIK